MDVIEIDCQFYKGDRESNCTNILRGKLKKKFLGLFVTDPKKYYIPICSEVSCEKCDYKTPNLIDEDESETDLNKVKKEKKEKVSKKKKEKSIVNS